MTGGVVVTTPYQTVHLLSVIPTEKNRVVVIGGLDGVVTQQELVLVITVQTTHVYTESGKNQEVHRSGDMTGSVVVTTPYLTVHLLSVIPTEKHRVVLGTNGVVMQIIGKIPVHVRIV